MSLAALAGLVTAYLCIYYMVAKQEEEVHDMKTVIDTITPLRGRQLDELKADHVILLRETRESRGELRELRQAVKELRTVRKSRN